MLDAARRVVELARMSILVGTDTQLCVSGITGREGTFHAMNNRRYGTQVVSGVTPGKGGQDVEGVPVFNTFHDAVTETGANTAMIFVPPRFAADSILEAEDAGIELVICITEGIPAHDELRVYNHLAHNPDVRLVGPNCPGHPLAGQGQRRHHPRELLLRGQRRRGVALGHADLPDRQRARPGAASATRASSASAATPSRARASSTSSGCSSRTRRRS